MKNDRFTGCGTALVTPFTASGALDEPALRRLVRRQIAGGIDFLVPCGTTGENPTLTRPEHLRVVEITVEEAAGRVPVLAGAGGYNTAEVVELAREVERAGADGLLSVTPYYNKPTQEGLYQHYAAVAQATSLPIVLYSVQGRTGVNIEPATLERLAAIDNIVAVKEASGLMAQITRVIAAGKLDVLSGDDILTFAVRAIGGKGVISVLSNVVPGWYRADAPMSRYIGLMDALFVESNPIPVKAAMAMMGLIEPAWRLPLVPPQAATTARLEKELRALELLP